jgi:YVTN family beta-propeller protein
MGLALLASVFPLSGPAKTDEPSSGSQLFVLATLSNYVTVIDTVTNRISAKIRVGNSPSGWR